MIIIAVISWFICGLIAAGILSNKGFDRLEVFIIGFLLGLLGLIGIIIALFMKSDSDKGKERIEQGYDSSKLKKCPHCAEFIKKEAIVCKHCGRDLPKEDLKEHKAKQKKVIEPKCWDCKYYSYNSGILGDPSKGKCELHNKKTLASDSCEQFVRKSK
jgi:hypothetical protein